MCEKYYKEKHVHPVMEHKIDMYRKKMDSANPNQLDTTERLSFAEDTE